MVLMASVPAVVRSCKQTVAVPQGSVACPHGIKTTVSIVVAQKSKFTRAATDAAKGSQPCLLDYLKDIEYKNVANASFDAEVSNIKDTHIPVYHRMKDRTLNRNGRSPRGHRRIVLNFRLPCGKALDPPRSFRALRSRDCAFCIERQQIPRRSADGSTFYRTRQYKRSGALTCFSKLQRHRLSSHMITTVVVVGEISLQCRCNIYLYFPMCWSSPLRLKHTSLLCSGAGLLGVFSMVGVWDLNWKLSEDSTWRCCSAGQIFGAAVQCQHIFSRDSLGSLFK
ncbi:hypothetical protein CEXT_537491 [Caerostris extrusa]|uniref:Uncharacterized protein n=1 Tax=Caerostris extrusa TaxID=172846 RepID=A0AAV4QJ08_CAEEX|nr:hypothetical protein CEXT_537491 [Caerostris extrusa]